MSEKSDALLQAHVDFEMSRLSEPRLDAIIEERADALFEWLEGIALKDVVTSDQIVGVIDRYVVELRVSGGITELAGQMANAVFSSSAGDTTRISHIFRSQNYGEFADKIVGLRSVQRELIRYLIQSSAFSTLSSRMASRMMTELFLPQDGASRNTLVMRVVSALGRHALPRLKQRVEPLLTRYAERHAERLTSAGENHLLEVLDPEWVRQMADEFWDAVAEKPLSDVRSVFGEQDLEDFVVLGYEFWLNFRQTPYFKAVSTEVVGRLFEKYGEESVVSVIEDMGVSKQMVVREIRAFLPHLLERARRSGFLEQEIRQHLADFYDSPEASRILAR